MSEKLTIEQIMGLMSKQKFYVATEHSCESYNFVAMNPMTGKPLVVAISNYNYGKAEMIDPASKRCEFYLEYYPALEAFIRLNEDKLGWWKERVEEHKQELLKKSQS